MKGLDLTEIAQEGVMESIQPQTNLIGREETQAIIKETLEFLSNAVGGSLGPFGYNTIVQERTGQHSITKDGFTILRNLYLYEKGNRGIFDNLISISKSLVQSVGDGSSSAIIIAKQFFELLSNFKDANKINANVIKSYLTKIEEMVEASITEASIKLDDDSDETFNAIEQIARVSTNGDEEVTSLVRKLYEEIGLKGQPDIELSKTENSVIEVVNGFQFDGGYFHDVMINDSDTNEVVFENPNILMSNGMLTQNDIGMLSKAVDVYIMGMIGQNMSPVPLVVLAPKVDAIILEFFVRNLKQNASLPIALAEIPVGTEFGMKRFNDLAAFLGIEPLDKRENEHVALFPDERWGTCEKIKISSSTTTIIGPKIKNEELLNVRLTKINTELEEIENIHDAYDRSRQVWELKKRLISLTGSLGTIYIGGQSEVEKLNRRYLVDDAVLAVKSAIKHGYVFGGNLLIPMDIETNFDRYVGKLMEMGVPETSMAEELLRLVSDSFLYSYKRVLDNYYSDHPNQGSICDESENILMKCMTDKTIFNLKTMQYEDLKKTGVINSLKTDVQIMKSVFSIITLLVTSNQMLKSA